MRRLAESRQQLGTDPVGWLVGNTRPRDSTNAWVSRTGGSVAEKKGVAYCFLMFAQSGMDDTHIEENLARVGDLVELSKGIVEFIVVITT